MSNRENDDDEVSVPVGTSIIMVVEPDVLARLVIADYLRRCGYMVIEGSKTEDVFTILESGAKLNIVFADVGLSEDVPGTRGGFGLASRIRETYPGVDVILTSGVASAADKAGDICEDGPLEKPFHPQEVVRRINLLRERRRTTKT